MYLYPDTLFLDSELDPLARAVSELLSWDFNHVADRMSQLSDEVHGAFYLEDNFVPAERVALIHGIVRDMVACSDFDTSKQEDWAGVDPEVLFPYVHKYLGNAVYSFAKQFDVALNYLAYRDIAEPDEPFGHDVYGACCYLIDCLVDAGDITAAAFCDTWYDGHTMRMLDLLGFDFYEDMFVRARALQYCSLNGYTFADIEAELAR